MSLSLNFFGPQHSFPFENVLLLNDGWSLPGQVFEVKDSKKIVYFRLDTTNPGIKGKSILIAAVGHPAVVIKPKMFSFQKKIYLCNFSDSGNNSHICSIIRVIENSVPVVHVFHCDNDSNEPDLKVAGDFLGRNFKIIQVSRNQVVAEASRQYFRKNEKEKSKKPVDKSLLLTEIHPSQSYWIRINPFVDVALILGLTAAVEKYFIEQN